MTQDTITETRTETTTLEITKHRCPLCETYHESDDLAATTIGEHETELCRFCAASVLDVDAETIEVGDSATDSGPSRLANTLATITSTAIVITVGILVVSAAASGGTIVFDDLTVALLDLLPIVLTVIMAWLAYKGVLRRV